MQRAVQSVMTAFLVLVTLLGVGACSGFQDPRREIVDGFAVPEAWAFPPDAAVPHLGAGGMVATTDGIASETGANVLRMGGNAVDAAIATHFALAVVNPEAGNIGGGGFMIVRMANGETAALDFREKAPLAASRDMFLDADGNVTEQSLVGHLAAGVPGSVAGMWEAHLRLGSLPWADLLQPAIDLADGMMVHSRLARSLEEYENRLRRYPETAGVFLPNGRAPRVGERLAQPDLAATLRRIALEGADGFYRGRTADLIELEMRRGGGIITRDDLARYAAVWRDPIVFDYRDHIVISMPPPSSGGAAIAEILNILEGYDLGTMGFHSPQHVHLWAEAMKRAFADRNVYLADPDFIDLPVAELTSKQYAADRRAEIRLDRATPSAEVKPGLGAHGSGVGGPRREAANTTHYSVLDGDGSAVAVTTTINGLYGSLVTVAGAGFLLNNEMDDFAGKPGSPNQFGLVQGEQNAIGPEKRMLSSMTPAIVLDDTGQVRLITGSPGGPRIISSVVQVVSNVVDFGMDIAMATAAPRLHHQHLPDILYFEEDGLSPDVISALSAIGHHVEPWPSGHMGDTQSIHVLDDGTGAGAADPRQGGAVASVR